MPTIRTKRGPKSQMPTTAPAGVIHVTTDTHELYVGTNSSVVPIVVDAANVVNAGQPTTLATLDSSGKVPISQLPAGASFTPLNHLSPPADTDAARQSWLLSLRADMIAKGFMQAPATYSISGVISGDVLSGVLLRLQRPTYADQTVTSNSGGAYTFASVEEGGVYTLTPTLLGYTFTPSFITISNLTSALVNQNFYAEAAGSGIQPHATLVMGHNYEGNLTDLTGNFPAGWTGTPQYVNAWTAQGQGISGFNSGGRTYFVNSALGSTFAGSGKKFTLALHLRTGSALPTATDEVFDIGSAAMRLRLTSAGRLRLETTSGWSAETNAGVFATNSNYHIALTWDHTAGSFAAGLYCYINGAVQSLTTSGAFAPIASSVLNNRIGPGLPSDYGIYSLAVYNVAHSAANITRIMNNLAPLP